MSPSDVHQPNEPKSLSAYNGKNPSGVRAIELIAVLVSVDFAPLLPVRRGFDQPRLEMTAGEAIVFVGADRVVRRGNLTIFEVILYPIVPFVQNRRSLIAKTRLEISPASHPHSISCAIPGKI
jgi:hypothetical protein